MKPQICARCFWTMDRELDSNGIKFVNKKVDMSGSIKLFD